MMVDDIIHRSQSPVRNFNNHKPQGEGVIYYLKFECPNLPCGEEAKRMREPSSNYERDYGARISRRILYSNITLHKRKDTDMK